VAIAYAVKREAEHKRNPKGKKWVDILLVTMPLP
jgi:hypothetical protein